MVSASSLVLAAALASPYFILIFNLGVQGKAAWDLEELRWAFENTLKQSGLSALLSVVVGCGIAVGMNQLRMWLPSPSRNRWIGLIDWALVLPSFLPPIFLILIGFKVFEPFPFGFLGIALVHALSYSGLVGVNLNSIFNRRLGVPAYIAEMYGARSWFFWRNSFGLIRADLLGQFLLILVASFASFSIPLVMGGGSGTTLEVLIFEKITIEADLAGALGIALLQTLLLLVICPWMAASVERGSRLRLEERSLSSFLRSRLGLIALLAYLGLILVPMFSGMVLGWQELWDLPQIQQVVLATLGPSLLVSLVAGVLFGLFLFALVSPLTQNWLRRGVRGWVAPSTALVGLALLLLNVAPGISLWFFYALAFVVISVSSLYRWGLQEELQQIEKQSWIARSYGASPWVEFRWVQMPHFWKTVWRLSGIGAIWMLGDFALGKMVLGGQETLPLVIESLLGGYRIEAGLSLASLLFLASGFVWLVFQGVGRVLD